MTEMAEMAEINEQPPRQNVIGFSVDAIFR